MLIFNAYWMLFVLASVGLLIARRVDRLRER
jgi:hypothetical protein